MVAPAPFASLDPSGGAGAGGAIRRRPAWGPARGGAEPPWHPKLAAADLSLGPPSLPPPPAYRRHLQRRCSHPTLKGCRALTALRACCLRRIRRWGRVWKGEGGRGRKEDLLAKEDKRLHTGTAGCGATSICFGHLAPPSPLLSGVNALLPPVCVQVPGSYFDALNGNTRLGKAVRSACDEIELINQQVGRGGCGRGRG